MENIFIEKYLQEYLEIKDTIIYFAFQSTFMEDNKADAPLDTIKEIRSIMERSARFLSLSGWSGIWAGSIAMIGAVIANIILSDYMVRSNASRYTMEYNEAVNKLLFRLLGLAISVFIVALIGGYYFTYRKNKKAGISIWNNASKKMLINLAIPMMAGTVVVLAFITNGDWHYVASACLIFYGLALINGSKYTVSDIKYLGLLEVILGCIGLFIPPGYGLYLWALGFGLLHIVYGIIMWRKYETE